MSRSSKRIAQGRAGRQQASKQIQFAEIINTALGRQKILPPTGQQSGTKLSQSPNYFANFEKCRATRWRFSRRDSLSTGA